ncbi:MAG: hypothetical protein ACQESD_01510 [Thermoplasmatota archaeon]
MDITIPLHLELLYYLLTLPILMVITFYMFLYSRSFLEYFDSLTHKDNSHKNKSKKNADIVRNEKTKMRKYEAMVAVILLLVVLSWSPAASDIADQGVHREIKGQGGALEIYITDPVIHSLGPSYDTDSMIEEMEEKPRIWLPEEVDDYVDLEDITRLPGRLAIYRLYGGRYIITYTYLSPFPIIKAYGFLLNDNGDEIIHFSGEDTILYPFNPARAGDIAD